MLWLNVLWQFRVTNYFSSWRYPWFKHLFLTWDYHWLINVLYSFLVEFRATASTHYALLLFSHTFHNVISATMNVTKLTEIQTQTSDFSFRSANNCTTFVCNLILAVWFIPYYWIPKLLHPLFWINPNWLLLKWWLLHYTRSREISFGAAIIGYSTLSSAYVCL